MVDPKRLNGTRINLDRYYAASDRQIAVTRRAQALLAAAGEAPAEPRWYALTVRDGSERLIAEVLTEAGWTAWLAMEPQRCRRARRTYLRNSAVFRGYVFIRMRWSAQACAWMRTVDRLYGIVGRWDMPTPIGDREMLDAQMFFALTPAQRKRQASLMVREQLGIKVGDTVKIIGNGPLADQEGVVVEEADVVSMWVEILLFGRSTRVRVDLANLEESA